MRQVITTDKAPKALAFYSQAIVHSGVAYVAGQIPSDPATGQVVEGDIKVQATRVLENVKAILEAAGSGLTKTLRVSVYLSDMNEFAQMNEVYGTYFPVDPPARTTVQVARLPRDVKIEIDCIAAVE
ncbi:MAG TPA: Rid family detoxifying hydrolase [Bryobacteraceae bacterium]|nr:Rid family detoxifying hydrolase [Bryobacteraceae bacterium]